MKVRFLDGARFEHATTKVVCVGRNYAAHAAELNNPVPAEPMLFIKPATALVPMQEPLTVPDGRGPCHFETEVAVLIDAQLKNADKDSVATAIGGYGLAFDLTLREVQQALKEKGHPWEIAKGFDGACPISPFVAPQHITDHNRLEFSLTVDGQLQQAGNTADMITPIDTLIAYMSQHFTLLPGDIVLTGTPAGVGPLVSGQQLEVRLGDALTLRTAVS